MAGSINKVILIGNLGADPEVRYIKEDVPVANFNIATTESYRDRESNEMVENTDWHRIVLWRGLAQVAEKYLKKGDKVYIEGKLRTRSYEDKDGQTKYITEVVANEMVMLGGTRGENQGGASESRGEYNQNRPPVEPGKATKAEPIDRSAEIDDDLPF